MVAAMLITFPLKVPVAGSKQSLARITFGSSVTLPEKFHSARRLRGANRVSQPSPALGK